MKFPGKKIVKQLREQYPQGTRVKLVRMSDSHAPAIGTLGYVVGVDDIGSIMVNWDNGSRLNVLYGIDECVKI